MLREDRSNDARFEAARALRKIGDPSVGSELLKLVTYADPKVRNEVVLALGRLRYAPAVPELTRLYARESAVPPKQMDRTYRERLIGALAFIGDPSSKDLFLREKNAADLSIALHANEGLARIADPATLVEISRDRQQQKDPRILTAQAWALYRLGRKEFLISVVEALGSRRTNDDAKQYLLESRTDDVPDLFTHMTHADPNVREALAEILGLLGDARAVPALQRADAGIQRPGRRACLAGSPADRQAQRFLAVRLAYANVSGRRSVSRLAGNVVVAWVVGCAAVSAGTEVPAPHARPACRRARCPGPHRAAGAPVWSRDLSPGGQGPASAGTEVPPTERVRSRGARPVRSVARGCACRGARPGDQAGDRAAGLRGAPATADRGRARPHAGGVRADARCLPGAPALEDARARYRAGRWRVTRRCSGRWRRHTGCRPTCSRPCGRSNRTSGRFSGVRPTIQALATLAWDGRRAAFFRRELLDALTILDRGDIEPERLKGSWAGALGQPQFMPSTYLRYAQDFDGDGRRDIWRSLPDVFASIANFLKENGWKTGRNVGPRGPRARARWLAIAVAARRARPKAVARSARCRSHSHWRAGPSSESAPSRDASARGRPHRLARDRTAPAASSSTATTKPCSPTTARTLTRSVWGCCRRAWGRDAFKARGR